MELDCAKRVAVIATGESVNQELVDFIFDSCFFDDVVCVSNSYVFKKRFSAIVSSDKNWWDVHRNRIEQIEEILKIDYKKLSAQQTNFHNVTKMDGVISGINSGVLGCIVARKIFKAKELYLFGVDLSGGHFFGSHTRDGLLDPDQKRFNIFEYQYAQELKRCLHEKVKIFNCSEKSNLQCIPKLNFKELTNK